MAKYKDRQRLGPSRIAPFIPGEHHADRHARRLGTNLQAETEMRAWVASQGLQLRINNNGHHWIFERPGFFAEWWPSSAKLVIGRRYKNGIHVYDWTQAQAELARQIRKAPPLLVGTC